MEELYTVKEVSKIFRTNPSYVYKLIEANLIEVLKLGSLKIKKSSLDKFLNDSVGKDLSDPFHIKELNDNIEDEDETDIENNDDESKSEKDDKNQNSKKTRNKEVKNDRAC